MSKGLYNKIIAKFLLLEKYMRYLKELQKASKLEFLNDFKIFGASERYLHLAIEVMIDTGKIIISANEMERPDENKEIFDILLKNKVITQDLYEKLRGIVGFRNILVHEYAEISLQTVFDKLQNNLTHMLTYKKQILKYLSKK